MLTKAQKTKLAFKKLMTADVVNLGVERPENFTYKTGQFAEFLFLDPKNPKKKTKRAYSICSVSNDKNIEFLIKLVPNGAGSDYIRKLNEGNTVEISGPYGHFILEDKEEPLVFIATGVGVAPIIGLLRESLNNLGYKKDVRLLFGLRGEEDIFLVDHLDELKEKHSNFDYVLTLSRPSDKWTGTKGRVTDYLSKYIDKKAHYYICGNIDMASDTKKTLEDSGIKEENIHFEAF